MSAEGRHLAVANPRTGDGVKVPAKMIVTFRPGREMEERVRRLKGVSGAASG